MMALRFLRVALRLARRGFGATSPNPMVGAVVVKGRRIIGRGWHRRAGGLHAEIEALRDAQRHGHAVQGATLYVTLEPCCTQGRTPPCTEAIIAAGVKRVVVGAVDPNPKHAGKGFTILKRAGLTVDFPGAGELRQSRRLVAGRESASPTQGPQPARRLARECEQLNDAFNHWIIHRTPFVMVKAAMTLDSKIATASGESKWITGEQARAYGMRLRQGSDVILVGVNTILADDPSLTVRKKSPPGRRMPTKPRRRIILDSMARTPLGAQVVSDEYAAWTTVVVSEAAPRARVAALAQRVRVLVCPARGTNQDARLNLRWLLKRLGAEGVTRLLVEGGGEVNASFLLGGLAQRVAFFYAPKILGGRDSHRAVAGQGVKRLSEVVALKDLAWRKVGADLLLTARAETTEAKSR